MNLPNQLTVARLVMVPLFVVFMSFDHALSYAVAYIVFTAASITDYYDGKIARERNLVTNFGKLLDPVADKVLIVGAFVMMMTVPELGIPGWTVVAVIAREFLITGARTLAASEGQVIAANIWGKTKTVLQMVYIFVFLFLLIVERGLRVLVPGGVPLYSALLRWTSLACIIFVAVFTVYSGVQFALSNRRILDIGRM